MDATRGGIPAAEPVAAQDPTHEHSHGHYHQVVPSDPTLRVKALESLLIEKGLVDRAALDVLIDTFEHKVGPESWPAPGWIPRTRSDC